MFSRAVDETVTCPIFKADLPSIKRKVELKFSLRFDSLTLSADKTKSYVQNVFRVCASSASLVRLKGKLLRIVGTQISNESKLSLKSSIVAVGLQIYVARRSGFTRPRC